MKITPLFKMSETKTFHIDTNSPPTDAIITGVKCTFPIIPMLAKEPPVSPPTLTLFVHNTYLSLHRSTKFYIHTVMKDKINLEISEEALNKELSSLDWLTFEWAKLPKFMFEEVFNHICAYRLMFFVGYFKTYFGPADTVDKNNVDKMIKSLWDHFNNKLHSLEPTL